MKATMSAITLFSALPLAAVQCKNPILHADFSDPDVCVGHDGKCYMTASSFGGLPGLPILVSDDLVNWQYAGHALERHPFHGEWSRGNPEHGNAVWAPSIRYRSDKKEYVIYWGDPDRGIYRVSAHSPKGPWGEPRLVVPGRGLIDPCPLYDDDGRIYLVNGWAQSRSGMNSALTVRELDAEETRAISDPVMVYDGLKDGNFTAEGPKFCRKDGEYWLFFPAGGVERGWQVAARAKSPYGPYEAKTVLAQGKTGINGPHQGAVVKLGVKSCELGVKSRELGAVEERWWFVHFRDKGAYGRIVCLEPMEWPKGGWPTIGNGGEPAATVDVPGAAEQKPFGGIQTSDEFNGVKPGLQWQFLGKSDDLKAWCTPYGFFRLYSTPYVLHGKHGSSFSISGASRSLWHTPNLMVQKFPAESFTATLKAQVGAKEDGEEAGLVVFGRSYARIGLRFRDEAKAFEVVCVECRDADKGNGEEKPVVLGTIPAKAIAAGIRSANVADVFLRVSVSPGKRADGSAAPMCAFAWSADGVEWNDAKRVFEAAPGKWIGATFGIYAVCEPQTKDLGWIDADFMRVERHPLNVGLFGRP